MEFGIKFWIVFWPINCLNDRKYLQDIAIKLGNFTENDVWIRVNCNAKVITIMPGDMLCVIWICHCIHWYNSFQDNTSRSIACYIYTGCLFLHRGTLLSSWVHAPHRDLSIPRCCCWRLFDKSDAP
jgi:hypothetical protein